MERVFEFFEQQRHGLEQRFAEKVQTPGHFLRHRRLLTAQLATHPEQLDFIAERADERAPLARRPPGRLQIHELSIDAPMNLQHGHALGFCRMRGDDGAHFQVLQHRAHLLGGHARRRRFGNDARERRGQVVVTAFDLDLAATAHGRALLRDAQQLKPDALRLQASAPHGARHGVRQRLAAQREFDFGLAPPGHVAEQAEQQIDDAGFIGLRIELRQRGRGGGKARHLRFPGRLPMRRVGERRGEGGRGAAFALKRRGA